MMRCRLFMASLSIRYLNAYDEEGLPLYMLMTS